MENDEPILWSRSPFGSKATTAAATWATSSTILHKEARKDHEQIVGGIARDYLSRLDDLQADGLRCHPFGRRCARSCVRGSAESEGANAGDADAIDAADDGSEDGADAVET